MADPAWPWEMNDNPVIASNVTLMIQHWPYYVLVSMLQQVVFVGGNARQHTSCEMSRLVWLENECPICLICRCRANKELCKHCAVSTLVRVILFDSLQCLIRSSSPLYTLTGKEIQLDSFTVITSASDDRAGAPTICAPTVTPEILLQTRKR